MFTIIFSKISRLCVGKHNCTFLGRAMTSYLTIAQQQPTYGVQYHKGITDKSERQEKDIITSKKRLLLLKVLEKLNVIFKP